ncbi:hypothetical protein ACQ3I4_04995 [Zafaria sp. Z1313]|uniref:hypothetical protein n=1 Tax=Zafaria sp. Z1313 TaxID=3423202 RepID=UPI003D302D28
MDHGTLDRQGSRAGRGAVSKRAATGPGTRGAVARALAWTSAAALLTAVAWAGTTPGAGPAAASPGDWPDHYSVPVDPQASPGDWPDHF